MGVIARYREYLPVGSSTPEVDLNEGSTPLVPSRNIGRALGLSSKAARNRVAHVLAKLGVTDRTQAAVLAVELGLANNEPV